MRFLESPQNYLLLHFECSSLYVLGGNTPDFIFNLLHLPQAYRSQLLVRNFLILFLQRKLKVLDAAHQPSLLPHVYAFHLSLTFQSFLDILLK
jgi:hypothetical protein